MLPLGQGRDRGHVVPAEERPPLVRLLLHLAADTQADGQDGDPGTAHDEAESKSDSAPTHFGSRPRCDGRSVSDSRQGEAEGRARALASKAGASLPARWSRAG